VDDDAIRIEGLRNSGLPDFKLLKKSKEVSWFNSTRKEALLEK
jgi:hypothetical protein